MSWTFIHIREKVLAGDLPLWLEKHPRKARVILNILSTPPWVSRSALRELEKERNEKQKETGTAYTIDHIVPVCHPLVCGLTVPWNLRVIPKTVNARKSNRWDDGAQLELALEENETP